MFHSDIKPENIAFSRNAEYDEYEPKLLDFGAAVTEYNSKRQYSEFYFFNGKTR